MMIAPTPPPAHPSDAALPVLPTLAGDAFAALFAEALPGDAALPKDPAPPVDASAPDGLPFDATTLNAIVSLPPLTPPELLYAPPPTEPIHTPAPPSREDVLALVHAGAARLGPAPPLVEQPSASPHGTLAKIPSAELAIALKSPLILEATAPPKAARLRLAIAIPGTTETALAPSPLLPILAPILPPILAYPIAPPAPPLPPDPARLAGQLAAALPRLQRNGDATVLTLDPARLGRVTLRWVDGADGAPQLTIRTAKAPTAALLGQHSAAIAVAVREAGGLLTERASELRITISADSASAMPNMLTDSDRRAPARPPHDPQALPRRAVTGSNDAAEGVPEPRSTRVSGRARFA